MSKKIVKVQVSYTLSAVETIEVEVDDSISIHDEHDVIDAAVSDHHFNSREHLPFEDDRNWELV